MRKSLLKTAVATLVLYGTPDAAYSLLGNPNTRTVPAGKTTAVMTYTPRSPSCGSVPATVTLVAKPQHGTVSHHYERTIMPTGRCYGRPTVGFVVTYTPATGFRGVDHFTVVVKIPSTGYNEFQGFAIIVE
jgi:hypothetical protein